MEADKDGDGKISFDEFCQMVASTVRYLSRTSLIVGCRCEHDFGGCITCRFGRVERIVRIPLTEGNVYHYLFKCCNRINHVGCQSSFLHNCITYSLRSFAKEFVGFAGEVHLMEHSISSYVNP